MPKLHRIVQVTQRELRALILKEVRATLGLDYNVELCDLVMHYDGGTHTEVLHDNEIRVAVTINLTSD